MKYEFSEKTYASALLEIIHFAKSTAHTVCCDNTDCVVCIEPLFIYIHMIIS